MAAGSAGTMAGGYRPARAGNPSCRHTLRTLLTSGTVVLAPPVKKLIWAVLGAAVLVTVIYGVRVLLTISSVERAGDIQAAEQEIVTISDEVRDVVREEVEVHEAVDATLPDDDVPAESYELPDTENPYAISPPLDDDMFEAILLIGADESGLRADAIILILLSDGEDPIMVSIPRDLYVENPCTESYSRINANLNGCGDSISGPELLSLAVGRFTGVAVDHFVLVDFAGFADAVDAVGGIDWCFEYPVHDEKAHLDAPAGCYTLDGQTALAWARSRRTQVFKDGVWQGTGASDFSRQAHQQELLLELLRKVASFGSIGSLQRVAETAVENVTLSESFSLPHAVGLAWDYRGIRPAGIVTIGLEADPYVTDTGAWVLQPTVSFNELLAEVFPSAFIPVAMG